MIAKIKPETFWKLAEMGLTVEEKYAFLWAFGHDGIDHLGCFTWNTKRFTAETELPASVFEGLLQKAPESIVRVGNQVWLRGYIEHQLGRGQQLVSNRICTSLIRSLKGVGKGISQLVLAEYPELKAHREYKPMPSPSNAHPIPMLASQQPVDPLPDDQKQGDTMGLPSPCHGGGEGEGEGEGEGGVGGNDQADGIPAPTLEEVLKVAALRGISEDTARNFWEWHDDRNLWFNALGQPVKWPNLLQRWQVKDRAKAHQAAQQPAGWKGGGGRPPTREQAQERIDQLQRQLEAETDPKKKAAIIMEQVNLKPFVA